MSKVRLGIIGAGNMGSGHIRNILAGKCPEIEVVAVADRRESRREAAHEQLPEAKIFNEGSELIASGVAEAVLIATPHYQHPVLAIDAFKHGLHVMCEKPAGVYTKQVREMNAAAEKSGKAFGIMYNQRTNDVYAKTRELVKSGELGEIQRAVWIITDWYRPQAYHNSSDWRSMWSTEGGGALINQCPHQLDLWWWILGMPERIRSFVGFGKFHDIEVEDDVTAYMEYKNGASGLFVTCTAEVPGTNRLEISGTRGKITVENNYLTFKRAVTDERDFNRENTEPFGRAEVWNCEIPVDRSGGKQHAGITQNFINAVENGEKLLAPGEEGIFGLTISNRSESRKNRRGQILCAVAG